MNHLFLPTITFLFLVCFGSFLFSQNVIPYGENKEVGKYMTINGVKHYYEVYGEGKPLLLIHGNSTGIKGWSPQIPYFSQKYKVFAIDCRGRGKSDLGKDSLSYLQTAKDMAAFIRQMNLDSVNVVGKSDGGIVGILMGIYYPEHIQKIVAFGANMSPDSSALYPQTIEEVHSERLKAEKMLAAKDSTQNWNLIRLRNRMMEFQPHISAAELQKIQLPVLVMSSDRDVIKEAHTFFIYQHIPFANLCIFNDETHYVPRKNPDIFNASIEKFLSKPFQGHETRFGK